MAKQKKGVEPAALKAYRLGKKRASTKGGTKKSSAKKKSSGGTTQAGMFAKPMNVMAALFGVWAGYEYRDDARIVKLIKDQKMRYGVMGAVGLGLGGSKFIPVVSKWASKIPAPARAFAFGIGLGNGVALAQVVFPKLLPAPKAAANIGGNSALNYGQRMLPAPATTTTRPFTTERLENLKRQVNEAAASMNGRMPRGVMTGQRARSTMTGRFSNVWS